MHGTEGSATVLGVVSAIKVVWARSKATSEAADMPSSTHSASTYSEQDSTSPLNRRA